MCTYSIGATEVRQEQAQEGEALLLTKLGDGKGFVSPDDPSLPVCIIPGTKLRLQIPTQMAKDVKVITLQTTAILREVPHHREETIDALVFYNGKKLALIDCDEGITAEVISVPVAAPATDLAHAS